MRKFCVLVLFCALMATVSWAQGVLPESAELVGEGFGYKAYTVETGELTPDEEPQKAFWLTMPDGKTAELFRTALKSELLSWEKAIQLPLSSIMAVDEVYFIKNKADGRIYMVIQGCPDSRNIYPYLVPANLSVKKALFLPAADGFAAHNVNDNTLNCMGYAYDEETGRYPILKVFDFNGKLLLTKRIEEDAEADGRGPDEEDED